MESGVPGGAPPGDAASGIAAVEHLIDPVAVLDREWRYVYVNAAYERLRGMRREQLLGRELAAVLPGIDKGPARDAATASLRDGVTRVLAFYDPHSGRWLEGRFTPHPDGLMIVLRPAADPAEAQRVQTESDVLLRVMTDASPVHKAYIDRALRYCYVNAGFEEYFGRPREQIVGRRLDELLPPEAAAELRPLMERALAGERVRYERERRWPDGSARVLDVQFVPDLREGGRIPGFVMAATDITHVKQAEREVRSLNASLEARVEERTRELGQALAREHALAAVSRALYEADDPQVILSAALDHLQPALGSVAVSAILLAGEGARYAGYRGSVPAITAQHAALPYVPLSDLPLVAEVARSGLPLYAEDYHQVPNARADMPSVAISMQPVVRKDGAVAAVLAVSRERELGPFSSSERGLLAQVAAIVSVALERAEARLALERRTSELEELTSQQESFAYTVSHDLKTPLISMDGMTALLRDSLAAGDLAESSFLLERMSSNVTRMSSLVDGMLALSRVGRVALEAEDLHLGVAVQSSLHALEPLTARRGVVVRAPDLWPLVRYPKGELDQVLTNLLSNACKWAGQAGGAPSVDITWAKDGERVLLSVSDNGPGIEPRHRERVFTLFQRLDPKTEGTGVGLPIVKRIVERHGGKVVVEDGPLGGARFTVSLPVGN